MKRRAFVSSVVKTGLCTLPMASTVAMASTQNRRLQAAGKFVLFTDDTANSEALLSSLAPFLDVSNPEWRSKLVRIAAKSPQARSLGHRGNDEPMLVRMPDFLELTSEVEIWNSEWLTYANKETDEEEEEVGCYPISGGWWSVEGDWDPSRRKVQNHLFHSPNHTDGEFEEWYLDLLSKPELQSLHSDHHREMIDDGAVYWDHVNTDCTVTEPEDPEEPVES